MAAPRAFPEGGSRPERPIARGYVSRIATAESAGRTRTRPAAPHQQIAAFLTQSHLPSFRRRLLRWYGSNARDLPWRRTSDPYAIWVSEIMLQQTTVAAVIPYFERFLTRFPTVRALAAAPEADVLKAWEGLGYYSRARNLHCAAQRIVAESGGSMPQCLDALQALPGIGRYTAGAIASFAFDLRAPILEANTLRLCARLLGCEGDPRSAAGQALLWQFAEALLPKTNCGRFNQALMELGAVVCTVNSPRCDACPLVRDCVAFRRQAQHRIPLRPPRAAPTEVHEAAVAIGHRGRYLLRCREPGERWAGLWDFPRLEVAAEWAPRLESDNGDLPAETQRTLEDRLAHLTGIDVEIQTRLATIPHSVTRYRIRLHCFAARPRPGRRRKSGSAWQWVTADDLERCALPASARKLARLLLKRNAGRNR